MVSTYLFVILWSIMNLWGYPLQTGSEPSKMLHSYLQAVRHGQEWDPGQLSELGYPYAGQGSMCPRVCALLSQLFQDLRKQREKLSL